jgi:hypothetical protein
MAREVMPSTDTMSLQQLETQLSSYGISAEMWGTGNAKTVRDLQNEINNGESVLSLRNNELIRTTEGLAINVFCRADGATYRLKEEKQVFTDGRTRVRGTDVMDTSLGEKLTKGEHRDAAVLRAINEELGISDDSNISYVAGPDFIVERKSNSYPGLTSVHTLHRYEVLLPESAFKPGGYIESQPTKSTHFAWEEVQQLPTLLTSFLASSADQGSR